MIAIDARRIYGASRRTGLRCALIFCAALALLSAPGTPVFAESANPSQPTTHNSQLSFHNSQLSSPPTSPSTTGTLALTGRLATIPHNAALERALLRSGIQNLAVQYDGLPETLASRARIHLNDLSGRESIHGQSPVFTYLSMIYEPELWIGAEIFPVDSPRLARTLGLVEAKKWLSLRDYLASPGRHDLHRALDGFGAREDRLRSLSEMAAIAAQARALKLRGAALDEFLPRDSRQPMLAAMSENDGAYRRLLAQIEILKKDVASDRPGAESAARFTSRIHAFMQIHDTMLGVPDSNNPAGEWMPLAQAAAQAQPKAVSPAGKARDNSALFAAAHRLDATLSAAFATGKTDNLPAALREFEAAASAAEPAYPPAWKRSLRTFYAGTHPFAKIAWVYLISVLFWGLWAFYGSRWLMRAAFALLWAAFAAHTAAIALRWILSGYLPLANMFESVVFAAWAAAAAALALWLRMRHPMFGLAAGAWGFLALTLVSLLPLHQTRIHALRAVLNSYWLNIHVTAMMLSYGAFLVAALFAGMYILKSFFAKSPSEAENFAAACPGRAQGGGAFASGEQLEVFAYRCIQVGWPLLTVGIFLGGVWAQTAWGASGAGTPKKPGR